jgi:ABC-type dipeptide/oligopeptide/nickel transport system ATPase component
VNPSLAESGPLLQVENLAVRFQTRHGGEQAVAGVDFTLAAGQTLAVVGESGSGKSVTALALTRLLPPPPICRLSGSIRYRGRSILDAGERELRAIRGKQIAYIFQEPTASLNPVFSVGYQIAEAITLHFPDEPDPTGRTIEALRQVGIRDPERRYRDYPHQLSGGMNQRVMIAMALACRPAVLVADEPTTALDVTIQAEIMALLGRIRREQHMAILLITHNFGIVKDFADRVAVMFKGRIVETGPTAAILSQPRHPYTRALIECIPRLGARRARLPAIDYTTLGTAP